METPVVVQATKPKQLTDDQKARRKASAKAWYERNKESLRAYALQNYYKNHEQQQEASRERSRKRTLQLRQLKSLVQQHGLAPPT